MQESTGTALHLDMGGAKRVSAPPEAIRGLGG